MSFVHLHVHSHYSLLDGLAKIPDIVSAAKQQGANALALTDHGSLYGAIEFYIECKKENIKPIIGMEAYIAPRALHLKKGKQDSKNFHVTLLAQNEQGYKNLMTLSTIGFLDGFYYKPRIDRNALRKYSEGVICLSGCPSGEIRRALGQNDISKARNLIKDYLDIFGDRFYIELQILKWEDPSKMDEQKKEVQELVRLAEEFNIETVATNDVHYINSEDTTAHDVMICINTGNTVHDKKRMDLRDVDLSFYSNDEMKKLFSDYPQAIENTQKIADRVDLTLDLTTWHYPTFKLPDGCDDANSYLREQVKLGAKKIYGKITEEMQKRMDYEFDIIEYKNYADYFLIFADFMQWAREQGIMTTARGSASGSLISYCLNITSVDPMEYKLPFDRFLTKKRPSPPDIDCDIQDDRRDEVIDYVRRKYGRENVAQVCTFGTMMARGSFRDVSRALGKPHEWADRIAKLIPFGAQGHPMTLDLALEESPDLKREYDRDPEIREVYEFAKKIEGCARHVSVHAAAVVLTPNILTEYVPLQIETKGRNIITQYDMYKIDPGVSKESVGVLKMDFLGLRNLSILAKAIKLVKKVKEKSIDIYHIPTDDKKTFEMLSAGHTFGVFQLSSSGMTRYLKELEPTKIPHLIAMVALYRPGPMEIIPEYIKRKNNPSQITYTDPRLKDILEMSYGLFIYQDDILLTAIHLAGYEPDEADAFRKAMGKKVPEVMIAQKEKFYNGCVKNGLSEMKAKEIWDAIEPFASYGFNKAHAASYGMLAYRTAYMKANFTAEYMAVLMTCESGNSDKVANAIRECKELGIQVLPPDVNHSLGDFTYISDTEIRFGLSAIKNLGNDIISAIITERKSNGEYTSLENFLTRVKHKNLNKKSIEALVCTGAFDSLGDRSRIYNNIDKILSFIRYSNRIHDNGQVSLFAGTQDEKVTLTLDADTNPIPLQEQLAWEKELLGLYVSDHPMNKYKDDLPSTVQSVKDTLSLSNQSSVIVAGVLNWTKRFYTKKGDVMYFAEVEDTTGQTEILVFPRIATRYPDIWNENVPILIKGSVTEKESDHKIIVDDVINLRESDKQSIVDFLQKHRIRTHHGQSSKSVYIRINSMSDTKTITNLKNLLTKYPGEHNVTLVLGINGSTKKILTRYKIDISDSVKESIESYTGPGSVLVKE